MENTEVERRKDYPKIYEKLEDIEKTIVEIKTTQDKKILADIADLKKDLKGNGRAGVLQRVDEHDAAIGTICKNIEEFKEDKKTTSVMRWTFIGSLLAVVGSGVAGFTVFYGNVCALRAVVDTLVKTVDKLVK